MLGGSMPAGMGEGYPMDGESSAEMGSYSSSETGSGAVAGTGTSGTETGSATSDYPSDSMGGVRMMPGVAMDPANYRYVDNEYHPLPAQRVREAMRAGTPEDAFLVVAKRMPIRLRLIVDQRKLHRLLAEFGNSALPVEIRQVRVNRAGSSGGGMMGGYGGGSYGSSYGGGYSEEMGSYGGGMGEMMGAGSSGGYDYGSESETGYGMPTPQYGSEEGYGMGGMTYGGDYGSTTGANIKDRKEVSSTTNYDVPVEVYGIIYIYNPVDEQKLGIEQPPSHAGVTPTNTVTAG